MIPCSSFDNDILMMVHLWYGYYATLDKIIEMQTRATERRSQPKRIYDSLKGNQM